ncbi:MAG TPA: molybdopterin-dependent oxidoreductase [Candidatus Competibacteraceae bacterium]|nr:molybdopterin-dependent oxidoreductase [Candidatus Competibacteraceae bacterium]
MSDGFPLTPALPLKGDRGGIGETVRTTCPYCGVGCGVKVTVNHSGSARVEGDAQHPANYGRLCSKGAALGETLSLDDRLLYPEIAGQRASWDEALTVVADGFRQALVEHGPGAVAFYVSGQLLTEDYYAANKLMKGCFGSANIDTNSRLCMSSSVAGHQRAFGSDTVPGCYEDLEEADLVVLAGSNLAWCHPVLYQRILAARQRREGKPQLVVIDPRRTATCDSAEMHLPLKPGSDTALFNGLLVHLYQQDRLDGEFLEQHVTGFWPAYCAAKEVAPNVPAVAAKTGLAESDVAEFYGLWGRTRKVVTVYSQGVNQSAHGSDKVNVIINCHLATGRIGQPGMGPFSVTGQPNAMGGREVGGLANQLAAHMGFVPEDIERVQRFWQAPAIANAPGLKAVELFQAVADGRIKALWIMGTNPVVSLPDADAARAALQRCPLVIVSDAIANTDTVRLAHIKLPALTWGEKEGTVTNSERRISRQRVFLPPPGEAKPDWWAVTQVARRLGFAALFPFESTADIFREHAALSGFENQMGRRDFDISALAGLTDAGYDSLEPLQWPLPQGAAAGAARLFGAGEFFTADGKARCIAVGERAPAHAVDDSFPMVLNSGRIRDQWHTMTRTGKTARLTGHIPEPYVEIHPVDALACGVSENALARVHSRWGEMIVRVRTSPEQQPGSVFVPMHWGSPLAPRGRVNAAVNPVVDPLSGQPESKHTPVRVQTYRPRWHGFLLSREAITPPATGYRVSVRDRECWRYELAGEAAVDNWPAWARDLLGDEPGWEWLEFADVGAGRYRGAVLVDGRLRACLFVAPSHELPLRGWLAGLFATGELGSAERASLLAGRPGQGQRDNGRIVCACFGVGLNTLTAAIREQRLATPQAIGATLKAGTNCGSCVPELQRLITQG